MLVAAVVGTAAAAGLAALTIPVHADASFTFSRLSGTDRYATAGAIDQAAFPSGSPTVLLADGLPAHAPDALAASGVEGVDGIGVLLTDNTSSVPANALTALSSNKVHNIAVVGGTASVSSAQVSELKSKGYNVVTPFQGQTRYQTMEMIDASIKPSQVGTDANGNPTAILASGDPAHYVDALSAGALAYAKKFPIILTNSTSSTLQPEAQQVITQLGIKDLIVVGGTASIPASQYNPKPSGVTQVENKAGSDRSATSAALADYAISQKWLAPTNLDLARGDDGSDALAGAAFGGIKGYPTVITIDKTHDGSTTSFAQEHTSTLTGTSYIFGGTDAVPAQQASDVETAAGAASTAPAGSIAPTSGQVVTAAGQSTFAQSGYSYTYTPSDTYQLTTTASTPGASPSCSASSFSAFQSALTDGDVVTGTYSTPGKSTFCLNDQAPHPPSTVTAAPNTTVGGVTVTWSAPSTAGTDAVSSYTVWRAPATENVPNAPQLGYACPSLPSTAAGTSPQTPPSSPYVSLASIPSSSGSGGTFSYPDNSATAGTTSNEYCYAVSSVSPDATGGTQTGTATGTSGAVAPGSVNTGTAPVIQTVSAIGHSVTVTYNEAINPATVESNGSQFNLSGEAPTTKVIDAYGFGDQVILDLPYASVPDGGPVSVSQVSGSNGSSVCAANSTTVCAQTPSAAVNGTGGTEGAAPTMQGIVATSSSMTIDVNYAFPIDCATIDPSNAGKEFTAVETPPGSTTGTPLSISAAACPANSGPTSQTVALTANFLPGGTVAVTYQTGATDASYAIVSSQTGGAEPFGETKSATAG